MKTKLLVINLKKGGCYKTTMATNLAINLARNKKVLLIDLDPQGHVLLHFGVNPREFKAKSIKDFIETGKLEECILNKKYLSRIDSDVIKNLDILPGNFYLKWFFDDHTQDGKTRLMSRLLNVYKSNKYDYIICDSNPDWDILLAHLFNVADAWIVPLMPTIGVDDALCDLIDCFKDIKKDKINPKLKVIIAPSGLNIRKMKDKESGERKIVETISYQWYVKALQMANKLKDVYVADPISKSDQYENCVSALQMPICAVRDKKLTQFRKPAKQHIALANFILSIFDDYEPEAGKPQAKTVTMPETKVKQPKKAIKPVKKATSTKKVTKKRGK